MSLYRVEPCPLLAPDKRPLESTVTRSFMKLLRTGCVAVVNDCQKFFTFLRLLLKLIFVRQTFYRNLSQMITALPIIQSKQAEINLKKLLSGCGNVNSIYELKQYVGLVENLHFW